MITLITAWLTERIITVVTITLVAVAAVPTTLVLTTDHNTTIVLQQQQAQQQIVLIGAVKKHAASVIVQVQTAENTCNTQVSQLVAAHHIAPGLIQSQLAQLTLQLHGSVAPVIAAVQEKQNTFAKLAVITPEDEDSEIQQIDLIIVNALGGAGATGTITITCQTVTVQIQEIILVITEPRGQCATATAALKNYQAADKSEDQLEKLLDNDGDKDADKAEDAQEHATEKALHDAQHNACGDPGKPKPKDKP